MHFKNLLSDIDWGIFYKEFAPLTPYGQMYKSAYKFFTQIDTLEKEYTNIENWVSFISRNPLAADQISLHLKKMGWITKFDQEVLSTADLFLIKNFLFHYKAIIQLMDENFTKELGIEFNMNELWDILNPEKANQETFYLYSAYSPELIKVQNELKIAGEKLEEIKKKHLEVVINQTELDFRFHDFLVIKNAHSDSIQNEWIFKEVYDSESVLVKPIYPKAYFELHHQLEEIRAIERFYERKILEKISFVVQKNLNKITEGIQKTEQLDISLAKARLAVQYQMVKPILSNNSNLKIEKGHYLPLEKQCQRSGTNYTPINFSTNQPAVVISGANMGGKTMVLKSIGFFQVLAQMGFWVPAKQYHSKIFNQIYFIGNTKEQSNMEGLSSFGMEIHLLSKALYPSEGKTLLLMDELAKTTNSIEAKALLAGLLQCLASSKNMQGILSTHFIELPQIEGLSFYKMKGMDYKAFLKKYKGIKAGNFSETINRINAFMKYEVVETQSGDKNFQAIQIAETLGLNEEIINNAKKHLKEHYRGE